MGCGSAATANFLWVDRLVGRPRSRRAPLRLKGSRTVAPTDAHDARHCVGRGTRVSSFAPYTVNTNPLRRPRRKARRVASVRRRLCTLRGASGPTRSLLARSGSRVPPSETPRAARRGRPGALALPLKAAEELVQRREFRAGFLQLPRSVVPEDHVDLEAVLHEVRDGRNVVGVTGDENDFVLRLVDGPTVGVLHHVLHDGGVDLLLLPGPLAPVVDDGLEPGLFSHLPEGVVRGRARAVQVCAAVLRRTGELVQLAEIELVVVVLDAAAVSIPEVEGHALLDRADVLPLDEDVGVVQVHETGHDFSSWAGCRRGSLTIDDVLADDGVRYLVAGAVLGSARHREVVNAALEA